MGPGPDANVIISTLLLGSALVASTGFVGLYATNSPWRLSSVGRAMMTMAISLVLICVVGLLFNLLGPNYPGRMIIRNIAYLVLNVGLWWQLINLVKTQNRVNNIPRRTIVRPLEDQDKDPVA